MTDAGHAMPSSMVSPKDEARRIAAEIRRSQFGERLRAFMLAAPLLLLLIVSFAVPIFLLLSKAVYDPTISQDLPTASAQLKAWSGEGMPPDETYAALADDLVQIQADGRIYELAKTLNSRIPGARSQILKTMRRLGDPAIGTDATKRVATLKAIDFWNAKESWAALQAGANGFTSFNLLSALDLRWTADGHLATVPADQAIFLRVYGRTFLLAGFVTLATLALGFPLAYLISQLPPRYAAPLLILVLLPFWTSILVRTAAWTVLLQKFGLLNELLISLGIVREGLDLMYSRLGLIIAMTHIQLPFTLLPIYSVMRTMQPSQMRAALSLGARPTTAFIKVYLPQVLPGIVAGCLLTFILCLGYYITPALIGGASDQLISNFIANYVNVELNWEMAAALSLILLVMTIGLYALFARLSGFDRLKLG
jgi:putative spermidine/putrescine transport system permease protein